MMLPRKFTASLAFAAALSTSLSPAFAADIAVGSARVAYAPATVFQSNDVNADRYRWDRHRYRHYRHRGPSAGDVLAGVLIIGGIAAIASAATRESRERADYRYRDYRSYPQPNADYRAPRRESRYDARGIDNAVNMCVAEIERDVRVASVDGVDRTGAGWLVTGSVYDGDGFTCSIGNDGRIENVSYGQRSVGYDAPAADDRQWDEDTYLAARARIDGAPAPDFADAPADGPLPAYPGGPIEGDYASDD